MEAYRDFAYVYDELMADMPYHKWLDFALKVLRQQKDCKKVADLGCGTGSLTIPLAEAGYQMYGIDLSADMLALAKQKAQAAVNFAKASETDVVKQSACLENIQWVEQDMAEWQVNEAVDAVISFCDSINYLIDEDEVLAMFHQTYAALQDNGVFMFDCHPITRFEQYAAEQPFTYDEEAVAYIWHCDYDEHEHIIEHQLTIFKQEEDGKYTRFTEIHTQRAYTAHWLHAALTEAGFQEIQIYGDFSFNEANEATERLFFVARKQKVYSVA